jgi:Arc/MetJ-type ribon-helix-helix transcriptional regulator
VKEGTTMSESTVCAVRLPKKYEKAMDEFIVDYASSLGVSSRSDVIKMALRKLLFSDDISDTIFRRLDRQKVEIQNLGRLMDISTEVLLRFIQLSCYTLPDIDGSSQKEHDEQKRAAMKKYERFMSFVRGLPLNQ